MRRQDWLTDGVTNGNEEKHLHFNVGGYVSYFWSYFYKDSPPDDFEPFSFSSLSYLKFGFQFCCENLDQC